MRIQRTVALKFIVILLTFLVPFLGGPDTIRLYNYLYLFLVSMLYFTPLSWVFILVLLFFIIDLAYTSRDKVIPLFTFLWLAVTDGLIVYHEFIAKDQYILSYPAVLIAHIITLGLQLYLLYRVLVYEAEIREESSEK